MPPRKRMSAEERKIAKAFEVLGFNVNSSQIGETMISANKYGSSDLYLYESPKDRLERVKKELALARERTELEAESVLFYVSVRGKGFEDKICKECKLPFASTYQAIAYCSERCRYLATVRMGIPWNMFGKTDAERWNGRIPKTLRAEALKAAKYAIDTYDEDMHEKEEPPVAEEVDLTMEEIDVQHQEFLASLEDDGK